MLERKTRGDHEAGTQDGGEIGAQPTPLGAVQQRLGNSALNQRRAAVQRKELNPSDVPEWIREETGLTREAEQNFVAAQDASQVSEDVTISPPSGGALPADIQAHAEEHLGVQLNDVSLATSADDTCAPMGALAYTAHTGNGHTVALSSGVDLGSQDGQFTLMHELTHVAQQKRNQTSSLDGLGGDEGVRSTLESDADAGAARMLEGGGPGHHH